MVETKDDAKRRSPSNESGKPKDGAPSQKGSYLPDIHRSLPHSLDAEKGLLCSMLLSPMDVIGECVEKIRREAFYAPAHQIIYDTLIEFWNKKAPVDFITLTQNLADRGQLDSVGGAAYITDLFTFVPTAANASYYLEILAEKFTLREIIASCTECTKRAYEDQSEVNDLLDEVEQKIFAITQTRAREGIPRMQDLVMDAVASIEQLYERKGAITGLSTGFTDLDKMTDGLHAAEMFIIAARPSMGKTALAMNIAEHVAVDQKKAVAVFSLEMSAQQLVQRLICSRARVSLKSTSDGFMSQSDFPKLTRAASDFAACPMYIDDTSGLSILELRAKARRLKSQHDIGLIVIDYLQLLKSTSRRAQDNRQLEIAEISSGLKALAKELAIPIIVLAQLNRKPEDRGGKPRLSDLRESGSIEQDADIVTLLVRKEYYADGDDKEALEGEAELIIAKQRNGPVGEVSLTFLKQFTRFESRAQEAHVAA